MPEKFEDGFTQKRNNHRSGKSRDNRFQNVFRQYVFRPHGKRGRRFQILPV